MKKIFIIVMGLGLLAGCTWPQYYSYKKEVEIVPPTTNGSGVLIVGEDRIPLEQSSKEVDMWRTAFEKHAVYKKTGFEDYETAFKPTLTDDKWAKREGEDSSGLWLLVPTNTAYYIWDSWWKIPAGLVFDVFNIVIGLPSVLIVNPWFEYEKLDLEDAILVPNADLKATCFDKDRFISNQLCTSCDTYDAPVSSAEECARCPGRHYENSRCYLK